MVRTLQRRPSSTRDVVKVEEPGAQPCAETPESPFLELDSIGDGESALWSRLLAQSADSLESAQLLLLLAALVRWETRQNSPGTAVLSHFLAEKGDLIAREAGALAGSEDGAPLVARIAVEALASVWAFSNSESKEAREAWLDGLLQSRFSALKSLLEATQATSGALRAALTRALLFLRASAAFLFGAPAVPRQLAFVPSLFAPAELFWRTAITDASLLRAQSEVLNSADPEDRAKLGIYRIPSNDSAEFAPLFESALFSRFYVGVPRGFHIDRGFPAVLVQAAQRRDGGAIPAGRADSGAAAGVSGAAGGAAERAGETESADGVRGVQRGAVPDESVSGESGDAAEPVG